ncbi:MAG: PspC domain-containing protein [Caldisericaceae bacterium]
MKCYNHPDRDAVGVCARCGKAVCAEDSVVIGDKLYCKECAAKISSEDFSSKRLYRSRKDRVLCGVCGGLAEYLNLDPSIVRILWAVLTLFSIGTGIVIYIVMCLVVPSEP